MNLQPLLARLRGRKPQDTHQEGFDYAQSWPKGANQTLCNFTEAQLEQLPNPLREYFEANQSGPGIWKWQHYFDIYHRHFNQFVGQEVHVVEVGIYSGGSLPMWHHYFGNQCHVYGVDIEPACKVYESERTRVFIGDQADRAFWSSFRAQVSRVDILIDDGGHLSHQQIVTLEEMLPYLSSGGIYLCEDIHGAPNAFASYVAGLASNLNEHHHELVKGGIRSDVSEFQKAIRGIYQYPFCTVIEKSVLPIVEFSAPKHGTEWQPFKLLKE